MIKSLGLFLLLGAAPAAYVSTAEHIHSGVCTHGGFVSKELERELLDEETGSEMDEAMFNGVIDKVLAYYSPIVAKRGATLVVNRLWTNNTINASASQSGTTWYLNMYGGLARHVETSPDGFALVVCHELGHHIGENPKYPGRWASNEGQSDYFGAVKCFKKVFERDDNVAIVAAMNVDPVAKTLCDNFYSDVNANALCQRGAMAGMSLGRLLDVLGGNNPSIVKFETPDTKITTATNNNHPKAQCRLDTYLAGALCPIDHNLDMDAKDYDVNVCNYKMDKKFHIAARPLCWYKPAN